MVKENMKLKLLAEDSINNEFNKISVINFNGTKVKIAPVAGHIPKIASIKLNSDYDLFIYFNDSKIQDADFIKNFDNVELLKDSTGIVTGFVIGNINNLNQPQYKQKINNSIYNNIKLLSSKNENKGIKTHLEKRLLQAIQNFIKKISGFEIQNLT